MSTSEDKKPVSMHVVVPIRDKKIGFFGRYIAEKSVFGRHREEKAEEKSIRGKIREKSVKSPIFPPKNRDCGARALVLKFFKKYR